MSRIQRLDIFWITSSRLQENLKRINSAIAVSVERYSFCLAATLILGAIPGLWLLVHGANNRHDLWADTHVQTIHNLKMYMSQKHVPPDLSLDACLSLSLVTTQIQNHETNTGRGAIRTPQINAYENRDTANL